MANTEIYVKTISKGYLLLVKNPKMDYWRGCNKSYQRLNKPQMGTKFFDYIWKGWLNLPTPVLSNTAQIEVYQFLVLVSIFDSIYDIGKKNLELMLLNMVVELVLVLIRLSSILFSITGNGTSDGVVPFTKIYDSTILATNQGSVRRFYSVNLNIEHEDFEEWLEIREPKGDVNRQSLNLHINV